MRLVQHKKEAYWFYRFLSIFYDKFVNPFFWTERMRDESLELAELNDPKLSVIDVGSGTGFTTQGIVRQVPAKQVKCVDQSPHQMAKAKQKSDLQDCTFEIGDAENIPAATDQYDRYVSAGSIEYWPNPQQGICEAYRVIKPGGIATLIGPLEPESRLGKFIAEVWMLFPKDEEYREWFEKAGFTDIKVKYIRPDWYTRKGEYGLSISGVKPAAGPSPLKVEIKEPEKLTLGRRLQMIGRVLIGSAAGFLFIPAALFGYVRQSLGGKKDAPAEYREKLNPYQISALLIIVGLIAGLVWLILR
jgi:MPBQ/MSBQ methyltransferase